VVATNSKLEISQWNDLKAHSFAYVRGVKVVESNTIGMDRLALKKAEKVVKMVSFGRVQLGNLTLLNTQNLLPVVSGYRILEKPLQVSFMYHYVHKNNSNLVPLLNNAIILLRKTNEIK